MYPLFAKRPPSVLLFHFSTDIQDLFFFQYNPSHSVHHPLLPPLCHSILCAVSDHSFCRPMEPSSGRCSLGFVSMRQPTRPAANGSSAAAPAVAGWAAEGRAGAWKALLAVPVSVIAAAGVIMLPAPILLSIASATSPSLFNTSSLSSRSSEEMTLRSLPPSLLVCAVVMDVDEAAAGKTATEAAGATATSDKYGNPCPANAVATSDRPCCSFSAAPSSNSLLSIALEPSSPPSPTCSSSPSRCRLSRLCSCCCRRSCRRAAKTETTLPSPSKANHNTSSSTTHPSRHQACARRRRAGRASVRSHKWRKARRGGRR